MKLWDRTGQQLRAGLEHLEDRRLLASAAFTPVQTLALIGPAPVLPPMLHPLNLSAGKGAVARAAAATADSLYGALTAVGNSADKAPISLIATDLAPFSIKSAALKQALLGAPLETAANADALAVVLPLPMPDGSIERFKVVEAPIMEAGLAAQFPDIKTYRGVGVDDPTASVRLDFTELGFHAQVLSTKGSFYIDPYFRNDAAGTYASYYKRDMVGAAAWACANLAAGVAVGAEAGALAGAAVGAADPLDQIFGDSLPIDTDPQNISFAATLKTYRAAVAADGEYVTAVGGGTVSGGQAAVVTAVNRVTGVYETELDIRLVLVANNSSLIYTNAATDPYTNTDPNTLLTQNQANITSVIGSPNYDIGHVFTTGGGGLAGLGVVGNNSFKSEGETGLPTPTGDAFYIDYVAHEMGHQFGANHTFNTANDTGNRNAGTAYEPGSGSTIMAYAGIEATEDLQPHSDPYFHSASIDEIRAYIGTIPAVGTSSSTGNTAPTISAGSNFSIPIGTPFTLTATGSDPDGDTVTYEWQQRDLGAATLLTAGDNGSSPLFRDYSPTTSASRTLPQLASILSGTNTTAAPSGGGAVEQLYSAGRTSHWRVIARDNKAGGGGVNTADMTLTVVNAGGAFAVTSPNTNISWGGGSTQTVTWNVAGTTANGINTATVNILLSTDGGNTFPITLAGATANDGSEAITVPTGFNLSTARVKIQSIGNIFFDISNANFTLTPDTNGSIAGQTFEDRNANGTLDAGEPGINGVSVFLDSNNNTAFDPGEPTTTTSGAGNYTFSPLTGGPYHVRELSIPAGYMATSPAGGFADVAVTGGVLTQNFGSFPIVINGSGSADAVELRRSAAGTPFYSDNFNRAALAGGTNAYTTTVTAGDGGASVVGGDALTLTNDAGGGANANGVVYTTTPTSAFPDFNQQLSANTGVLTWAFNMQQARANPGQLTAGGYGSAFILGSTNGILSGLGAGNGYVVYVGQGGATDPVTLARFTGGLGTTTTITAATATATNHYWSIKVTYNPSGNLWSLFARDDGATAFANPLTGTVPQVGSTVADNNYTSSSMTHLGAYWAYSTAASQAAKFDNFSLSPPAGSSTNDEILVGGVSTYTIDRSLLPSLTFNLGGADDSLTVNYANGTPIPTGGVFYDGGAGTGDSLSILGSTGVDTVTLSNTFAGPTAGNINLNDPATGAQTVESVSFSGLLGSDSLTVASAPPTATTALAFNGGLTATDHDVLNLNAGQFALSADAGATTANLTLNVANSQTSVVLNTTQHLEALSINNGSVSLAAGGSRVINVGALSVASPGKLDLADNDLIVRNGQLGSFTGSAYTQMTGLIQSGRNGGNWAGSGIVTSQTSASAGGLTTLSVANAADIAGFTGVFDGETIDGSAIVVKYTYGGDANLDGKLNVDDYTKIDFNVPLGTKGFGNGDFNYDGTINVDDYTIIDLNVGIQGAPL